MYALELHQNRGGIDSPLLLQRMSTEVATTPECLHTC